MSLRAIKRKTRYLSNKEKMVVAYHEIGHALVAAIAEQFRSGAENYHHSPYLGRIRLYDAGGGGRKISDDAERRSKTRLPL